MQQPMLKIPCGQDPYDSVGKYIRDHITAIEDIIAVIEIDGAATNQLFMVDMQEDGYFVWKSDWWEGEENIVLLDFFPVSEATKPHSQPERKTGKWIDGKRMKLDGTFYWFRQCDQCGYERNDCDAEKDSNFCPDCGADMRGEVNG